MLTGSFPSLEVWYTIKVLRHFGDLPGFPKLAGAVASRSKSLKSLLVEVPKGARHVSEILVSFHQIPWARRERWAWQLVQAISQMHADGFPISTLTYLHPPILVDNTDYIRLWQFRGKQWTAFPGRHRYPPEMDVLKMQASLSLLEAGQPDTPPERDIWDLGRVLWCLATHFPRAWSDLPLGEPLYSHEALSLPRLPDTIPQYYRNMVEWCRAPDLRVRPTAKRILDLFPVAVATAAALPIGSIRAIHDALPELNFSFTSCDFCNERCFGTSFNCPICDEGDFDICVACYGRGRYCNDSAHRLVELHVGASGIFENSGRYHSSVKMGGLRDILTV